MHSAIEIAAVELRGSGASAGTASGAVALSPAAALRMAAAGPVVLVCYEASAEDVEALRRCVGVITSRGGLTGDGAIVARALKIPCVIGIATLRIDRQLGELRIGDGPRIFREGDNVALDGSSGHVLLGGAAAAQVPTSE